MSLHIQNVRVCKQCALKISEYDTVTGIGTLLILFVYPPGLLKVQRLSLELHRQQWVCTSFIQRMLVLVLLTNLRMLVWKFFNVTLGCVMLFGLIYVLNWSYATELKCTFEENPGYNQALTKLLLSNDNVIFETSNFCNWIHLSFKSLKCRCRMFLSYSCTPNM